MTVYWLLEGSKGTYGEFSFPRNLLSIDSKCELPFGLSYVHILCVRPFPLFPSVVRVLILKRLVLYLTGTKLNAGVSP